MGLILHPDVITPEVCAKLIEICPFHAMEAQDGKLSINAGCKLCKLCVKNGPTGAVTWEDEEAALSVDKKDWRGIAVYADRRKDGIHPVTLELLGKARELAAHIGHPVFALLIGSHVDAEAEELLHYGADSVYVYDDPAFLHFNCAAYANAFYDFIQKVKPSSILVGASNRGRSLAPRVAARCNTGLTADCTELQMKENTDLVQIRPAFGGNIMAQIVTPRARPQFCTVRYKIFSAPERTKEASGSLVRMALPAVMTQTRTESRHIDTQPAQIDISEAEVIVACGRGFQREADLAQVRELCALLHAQMAGTRPLIEAGWLDARRQIGLSGRTVKPRLIITLGISGSVQFAAGMKGSDFILAVNRDPNADIFNIAHLGIVGDLYEILPLLLIKIRGGEPLV